MVAYLIAKPLHVTLGELLARHEALDPAIESGNCGGLRSRNRRHLHGLRHLDILHVGVHGGGWVAGGGAVACCDVEGFLPFKPGV